MISLAWIWSLVFVYGVLAESPTQPQSDNEPEPSTLESFTFNAEPCYRKIDFTSLFEKDAPSIENKLKEYQELYSREVYPLFKKAVQELASSDRGISIFWDFLNSPDEHPREFYEKIFRAYNHMVDDDPSGTTTEEAETTTYNLDLTEPGVSKSQVHSTTERVKETEEADEVTIHNLDLIETEIPISDEHAKTERVDQMEEAKETTMYSLDLTEQEVTEPVSDMHYKEELVAETEDPEAFYHATVSSDGEEVEVYYSTENPEAEVVVLSESYFTSTIAPEEPSSTEFDMGDLHQDSTTEDETVELSNVATSESGVEDVVRRSGVLVETHPADETDSSSLPLRVGSIPGIPCKDFPCYEEIPITSFTCADKHIPGFYADLDTGCQVFHVCYPNRRESFLCPIGTTFNQAILACDYWYSSNCSLSPLYFEPTAEPQEVVTPPGCKKTTCAPETTETPTHEQHSTEAAFLEEDWFRNSKFVPVKSKVTVYFKHKDHAKHSSTKKTVPKIAKPEHVMPLVEDFVKLAKIVTKDVVKIVPKVVKAEVTKSKLVKKPAAKLVPCSKIEDHHKPTPPVVKEPKPHPTLNPRFIVKPVPKPMVKVHKKEHKIVSPKVLVKQFKPHVVHKAKVHHGKDHASEVVLKALEMAGDVFQRDILALTRQAMADSKPKH